MTLTSLLRLLAVLFFTISASQARSTETINVTDIFGRTVEIPANPQRIVLGEARQIVSLSLIDRNVANRIAGYAGTRLLDPELRTAYDEKFPPFAAASRLDDDTSALSAEKTMAADPDLVIMSGQIGTNPKATALVDTLSAAGIPAIYIDFRADPYENTIPSMELLGEVLGNPKQAAAFLDFYRAHRDAVTKKVATLHDWPKVLLHMQANAEDKCCTAPSEANLGRFVREAGGINIGAAVVPGAFAQLSPEYILSQDPDIYIGTGGRHLAGHQGIIAGPGIDEAEAEASLDEVAALPVIADLRAVEERHNYGLWHNFHNSPLNVVALEVMAKWFHPEAFADLDPRATLDAINRQFLPVPMEGALWIEPSGN